MIKLTPINVSNFNIVTTTEVNVLMWEILNIGGVTIHLFQVRI